MSTAYYARGIVAAGRCTVTALRAGVTQAIAHFRRRQGLAESVGIACITMLLARVVAGEWVVSALAYAVGSVLTWLILVALAHAVADPARRAAARSSRRIEDRNAAAARVEEVVAENEHLRELLAGSEARYELAELRQAFATKLTHMLRALDGDLSRGPYFGSTPMSDEQLTAAHMNFMRTKTSQASAHVKEIAAMIHDAWPLLAIPDIPDLLDRTMTFEEWPTPVEQAELAERIREPLGVFKGALSWTEQQGFPTAEQGAAYLAERRRRDATDAP